jgi:site-specific recombinase XerD
MENKNVALSRISSQPDNLAQIGESAGAIDNLLQLAHKLLGENFNPTMPANEADAAVILDWLRSGSKAESPKTQREYLRDVCGPETGFLTFVGRKELARITRQDMQNFKQALKEIVIPETERRAEHSLAVATQHRMLASVKGLLTHANAIGYTPFNPGKGVSLPPLPESKRDKALSKAQSRKMLDTAKRRAETTDTEKRMKIRQRDRLLNEVCYKTGGRISEVLALRWRRICRSACGQKCDSRKQRSAFIGRAGTVLRGKGRGALSEEAIEPGWNMVGL